MHTNETATRLWQSPAIRNARHFASPRLWYRYLTAPRRELPAFIIAGAQKAGTTSLFAYLADHPQCVASRTKEVHYFDEHFTRGPNWYRMHFPFAEPGESDSVRQCFESSPYYMFDPRVPARMQALIPQAKVIFLLRNPISRAYSHFQHSVRRGREALSFDEAIDAEEDRLRGEHEKLLRDPHCLSFAHRHFSYQARGRYAEQLELWRRHYAAEQMLVIQSERMFKQPREVFAEVLSFLGLKDWTPSAFESRNSGSYGSPISAAARERLARHFAPHNERLFELLGTRYNWQ